MIGQTISHYKILEKLGEGGMGVVYKAHDTTLDREVALKFLPREMTRDAEAIERFIHEAKAASALEHSNICNIHEIGETDDGRSFIVMAYYDGETVRDMIKRSPLAVEEATRITIQIAQGLAKAHEKKIVHRDIKTANIMVTGDGVVKILDFGLAKLSGMSKLTRSGSTVGTAPYMSPEQAKGEMVDHRTDIWSLGVVLYEMLTGRLPFIADYEQAVIYQIVNAAPAPVTGLREGIPQELERIANKCLEKDPGERYQTTADLIADLQHLQPSGFPAEAGVADVRGRSPRIAWRRSLFLAAILVIGIALIIVFRPFSPARDMRSIAVLPFKIISGDREAEWFSNGVAEDIRTQLSKIADLRVISQQAMARYRNSEKSITEIGRELDVATVLEGSVQLADNQLRINAQLIDAANESHIWAEKYDREKSKIFEIQSDVALQIANALKARLTPKEKEYIVRKATENTDAYDYYLKGREYYDRFRKQDNEEAIILFRKAIALDPGYALAWAGLGDAFCQRVIRFAYPGHWYDTAMAASKKAVLLNSTSAEAWKALGLAYAGKDYQDSSVEAYRKALELSPNYFPVMVNLGLKYLSWGDLPQAMQWLRKSTGLSPNNPIVCASLGKVYRLLGDDPLAGHYIMKAYDLQPDNQNAFRQLSHLYLSRHEDLNATGLMKRLADLNPDNPDILEWAGDIAAFTGDIPAAKRYYGNSLTLRSSNETINDSSGGITFAYILLKEGNRSQAEKILAKEMSAAKSLMTAGPRSYMPEYQSSCVEALRGNNRQALLYLQKAIERGFLDHQILVRDPCFENLHDDEEFGRLITKMRSTVNGFRKQIDLAEKSEGR